MKGFSGKGKGKVPAGKAVFWAAILFLCLPCLTPAPGHAEAVNRGSSWFVDLKAYAEAAHGTLTCEECHGTMKEGDKKHPNLEDAAFLKKEASRVYDYGRCKTCHRNSYERYLLGEHAKALKKEREREVASGGPSTGEKRAPTCGDCHSAHYDRSHLSKVEIGREMVQVCGTCHAAQAKTYLENYHGKAAVNLGDDNSAYCTDCHGAHHCVSLKKKEAALRACERCHQEASANFTQFVIHPTVQDLDEDDREKRFRVAVIKVISLIMSILVIAVVVFFYGHSFLWLLRDLHERLRKH